MTMDLLTIAETAKLLKVTPTTVRRYIHAGQLPAFKVGRQVRIRKTAVENLLSPITPTRPGAKTQEKGSHMRETERTTVPPLTEEEQRQVLAAIEQAKRERAELAAKYRAIPVPSSVELVDEARAQRTRELA
jgi:excisionase family DNA binding protein